jgi:diaminohydroxyphosphoribosylaminopyrimidine deaminase/5-amino-6-(5-phosphoribosylamino)uracil reductase
MTEDDRRMGRALDLAASVRAATSPNPWVGAVLVAADGQAFEGATQPPGGPHAEVVAIQAAQAAGAPTNGATLYTTLEPCSHHGRTPPCVDAIVEAGVQRVVVGIEDPDPQVRGQGVDRLRRAGIEVVTGVRADEVQAQLAPYLKHRRTGRPWVVLKLAATLDGRTAAVDGTSQWITGEPARIDAHRLRAESDAVLVGANTVRQDDPALTVRHVDGPTLPRQPKRIVLGTNTPAEAKVEPATHLTGDLPGILDRLGREGVVQLLVEGGATVAHDFHAQRLVDRYVVYLAPALAGGDDAAPMFRGPAASGIGDLWRGEITSVERLGADLKVELCSPAW